jgi:hypothetical protein
MDRTEMSGHCAMQDPDGHHSATSLIRTLETPVSGLPTWVLSNVMQHQLLMEVDVTSGDQQN